MFARLGSWCFRRRWTVIIGWVVAMVLLGGFSGITGSNFGQDFSIGSFESTRGLDTLEKHFGGFGGGVPGSIVFRADDVDDPAVRQEMERLFATVDAISAGNTDVADDPAFAWLTDEQRADLADADLELWKGLRLVSPYEVPLGAPPQISEDRTIAFAALELPGEDWEDASVIGRSLEELLPERDGLQVELGGQGFGQFEEPSTEALGVAFAVVILVVAFGSVLAMGLPIGVAIAGIAVGSVSVTILSNLVETPDFAPFLGIMIGLGVGIDYALFIVTRYRENVHHGHTAEEAVSIAIDTAGRAVAFAGVTVVVSFLGMLLMGVAFIQGLAVAAATIVLVTVVASLTLLPALLGFAGGNLERTRWRGIVGTGGLALVFVGVGLKTMPISAVGILIVALSLLLGFVVEPLQREVVRRPQKPIKQTGWYRWSRFIQRRPWPSAILGGAVLIVLTIPLFGLRLGFADESNFAQGTTTKQAYDLLVEGFGPGFNGPFVLAAELDEPIDEVGPELRAQLDAITAAVQADRGVAAVSPAFTDADLRQLGGEERGQVHAVVWQVTPTTTPQDEATSQLVDRLRDEVLVPGEEALGVEIAVTGQVPGMNDFSDLLSERMPYFFVAVLVLSFLLMMAVFRSILVPLKAVIMNLLSIGAAYGITVALVQWGWLGDLTGLQPGPIETFAPMMFFAIVFGLSMDYEVFLLSRIKEEYHRSGDSHTSVANGLAATARVITAAAAIMVFVFGAFLLENDRTFKLFGVGLASAILLDATVVRMLLVPATMELLGDRNWWLPRWLDRILPNIDVEGTPDDVDEFGDDDVDPTKELATV